MSCAACCGRISYYLLGSKKSLEAKRPGDAVMYCEPWAGPSGSAPLRLQQVRDQTRHGWNRKHRVGDLQLLQSPNVLA